MSEICYSEPIERHIDSLEDKVESLTREREEARQQLADKDREIERLRNVSESLYDALNATYYATTNLTGDMRNSALRGLEKYRAEQAKRESKEGGDASTRTF